MREYPIVSKLGDFYSLACMTLNLHPIYAGPVQFLRDVGNCSAFSLIDLSSFSADHDYDYEVLATSAVYSSDSGSRRAVVDSRIFYRSRRSTGLARQNADYMKTAFLAHTQTETDVSPDALQNLFQYILQALPNHYCHKYWKGNSSINFFIF